MRREIFMFESQRRKGRFFQIDQLAVSVSKSRINKRKIIFERTFALEGKELTCSFKLAKNFLCFRGLKYLIISNLSWHEK